jgi:cytochrome d ubiquinol oxidase subunit I
MQHPVGVVYRHGRINIASLGEILMNPMAADAIVHVLSAACVTGCVFALFVCSWYGLRRLYQTLVEHTFKIAAILGGISSILLIYSGHMSARDVAELQPMKFAAFEAIWHSEKAPASLVAFAVPDQVSKVNRYEVKIPYLLSFLTYGELEHSPPGLLDIAADDDAANEGPFVLDRLPNVPLLFSAFHLMVFCGVSLLVIFACVFLSQARNRLISVRKLQLLIMLCSPMPWLAASAGWLVKEAGRQPWSVYRILPTAQSLTLQVPSTKYGLWLMIALAALVLLGTFFVICLYLVRKGPGVLSDADHVPVAQTLELSCIVQEG